MKRFSTREHDIIYLLFMKQEGYTVGELSQALDVSHNTVIKILTELDSRLPLSWQLRRNEKGVFLLSVPNGTNLEEAWSFINQDNLYLQLLDYIFTKTECTNEKLIDHFQISRTTLYRRIMDLKAWLGEFDIELKTNSTFDLVGDERNIRTCMVQYYDMYFSHDLYEIDIFDAKLFERELKQQFEMHNVLVRASSLRNITLFLYALHLRVRLKKIIEGQVLLDTQENTIEYEMVKQLYKYFPSPIRRQELRNEQAFLSLVILSEFSPGSLSKTVLSMRQHHQKEYRYRWIFDLLNNLSNHFHFRLDQDDQLLFDLDQFARTELIHFQMLNNAPTNQYIQYVSYYEKDALFQLLKHTIDELSKSYVNQYTMNSSKQFELYLFIKSSILRKRNQLKNRVLLVYRAQAEKSLLTEALQYHFGHQIELRYVDLSYLETAKGFADFDFIVSTEPIDSETIDHIPILTVSSIMTQSELKYIESSFTKALSARLTTHLELVDSINW